MSESRLVGFASKRLRGLVRRWLRTLPLVVTAGLAGWLSWTAVRLGEGGGGQAAASVLDGEERAMNHGGAGGRKNRLAGESSPYLLLHQENPVDWYPWGPEAMEKARREGKPIFLSVGYSTCYWCHVMERESFSDPGIAELLNRWFVCIKVDREERPDVDEIYMTATQLLTQHGGWPNSVFLTPDLKPFYAGTYFPPDDRFGRPGFASLVASLADAWQNRRQDVEQHAGEVAETMRRYLEDRLEPASEPPSPEVARRSLESLTSRFDEQWGGFGVAPKFPTPSNLFLLRELAGERPEADKMLRETLDQMARGGIYDQLGGGFHRYATDREWKVPHFEKMLYDNGFLLELVARETARTGDPEMARVAAETARFLAREMTSETGAFLSAIDAETDAREGAFYVWSPDELRQVLGEEDFAFLAPIYGFDGQPFFEGHEYVLHLPRPLAEAAAQRKMSREGLLTEIEPLKQRLFAARAERKRPLTDDKILTDWNGIAVAGMALAGKVLGEPELIDRAARAARFVLTHMRAGDGADGGPLLHVWRGGKAKHPAYLADYVFLVRGLLTLHEVTGDGEWLRLAGELTAEQGHRLGDPRGGFFNAAEQEDLLFRPKESFDGALPAANGIAALNLLALAERSEGAAAASWLQEARRVLEAFGGITKSFPDGARTMTLAALRYAELARAGGGPGGEEEAGAPGEVLAPAQGELGRIDDEARAAVRATAEWAESGTEAERAGSRSFRVRLAIADGWHVNANPASQEFLIPTRLVAKGAELRGVRYPEPRNLTAAYSDEAIAVYQGTVELAGEIATGEAAALLELTYQACDAERCLRPVTVELRLE